TSKKFLFSDNLQIKKDHLIDHITDHLTDPLVDHLTDHLKDIIIIILDDKIKKFSSLTRKTDKHTKCHVEANYCHVNFLNSNLVCIHR
ncbi:hypothetical protein KAI60_04160, partial [Candidatus Bathyarchaeota archaeon]|nr:hypothetical protein [Candidatus Bathyarchaeota archaeon]